MKKSKESFHCAFFSNMLVNLLGRMIIYEKGINTSSEKLRSGTYLLDFCSNQIRYLRYVITII